MLIRYLQGGWWLTGEKKKRYGTTLNPAQFEYYRFNASNVSKIKH